MTAHSAAVTVGHGESTASAGAKKKPVPMYHAEPGAVGDQHESQPPWNRGTRPMSGGRVRVLSHTSRLAAAASGRNNLGVPTTGLTT